MKLMKYGELNQEQLIAIELLAQPKRAGLKYTEIAEKCGTTERTLQRWRQLPSFQQAVRKRTLELAGDALPNVMAALIEKAESGHSIKAIETYLRALGIMQDHTILHAQIEPDRSTEAIEREISELEVEIKRLGGGQ
ncbi:MULTISPECIES: phBC6A51 family helix-turn-helix protein [Brevibacillus]|uniref:phBC6A51 family helix-turn-helix protein n=1 Tax=Brevibacillus TaxID=55080 RepID=UPI0036258B99